MATSFPIKVPIVAVDRFSAVLGKMGGAAGAWGKKISRAGKQLTLGVTVPTVALGVAAAKTGITFRRSLNRVAAETSATGEEMAALRAQAESLAGPTHTLLEVGDAMALLAAKGEDVLSIQQQTPSVLKLATIANVDLAEAVEMTTDSLEVWGLGAAQAAEMTDLLAAASQRTNLGSLFEGLEAAGPRARATGQDIREVVSLLDILADEGFEGAKGGSAVAAALTAMVKPGRLARKELEGLQIHRSDLQNADGTVRSLTDVLDLLAARGASATQVLRIFGEGGDAMAALLEKNLVGAVRSGAASLRDVDGRAQAVVDTLTSGGVDSATRFGDAWDRVGVALAESGILDALAEVVRLVGLGVKKFEALSPETKKWIVIVGGVAATVGPALVVLGSLITVVSAIGPAIAAAATFFSGAAATVLPLVVAFAGIVKILSDANDLANTLAGRVDPAGGLKIDRPAMDALAFAGQGTSGAEIGGQRLEAAAAAGGNGARADVGGAVRIDFRNVPKGTKIETKSEGDVALDVTAGFNLGGVL